MAHFLGHDEKTQELLKKGEVLGGVAKTEIERLKMGGQPTGFSPITGADLAQVTSPKITPPTPVSTPDIQSIQTEAPQTPKTPTSDFTSQFEESLARLQELTTGAKTRVETAGIDFEKQLLETNKQIKMLQAEELGLKEKAEKRNVLEPFAIGEEARGRRNLAIEAIRLSAIAEAQQGNITLAQKQAQRAVDTEFAVAERDLRTKRKNILDNYDSFTAAQKKRADALLLELNKEDVFIKEKKDEKKDIEDLVIKAATTGTATNVDLEKIRTAKTKEEALQLAAPYLRKEEKPTGDIGEFENAKAKGLIPKSMGFFEYIQKKGAAGRRGEDIVTKLLPEDKRNLLGSGLNDVMIANMEEGVRTIGIDEVLKDNYTDTQKAAIRKIYGKESKEITQVQLLQAAQAMKQADVENFFTARFTEDEINEFAKDAGFAGFFKKRAAERTDYFASPKAREKLAELLAEQYKQQGFTIK